MMGIILIIDLFSFPLNELISALDVRRDEFVFYFPFFLSLFSFLLEGNIY